MATSKLVVAGVLGAVAGAAVTAVILSKSSSKQIPPETGSDSLPPDIEAEVFSRNKSFFGDDAFKDIRGSYVVVVGLGGVGSHAAHMLARSGVGELRIIDFDQVSLSSLNRHAVATLSDVGRPKSEVLKKHLEQIVPWCKVKAIASMFTGEQAEELLDAVNRKPDYILDCIDDVSTKADLIAYCQKNNIQVITCCAAGGKADPTRLHMGMLSDASRDPLASKMRWKLKKMDCDIDNIMTVYSSENPRVKLLPLTAEQMEAPKEFGIVDNFRTRVMPVLGTSPAVMGQAMASYVLCALAKQPFVPEPVAPMSIKARHKFAQHLSNREKKEFGNKDCVVDREDIEFIVSEFWHAKCAITGARSERVPMEITRWRRDDGDKLTNYVLLQAHLAKKLDTVAKPEDMPDIDPSIIKKIDDRVREFHVIGERYQLH
mmetsp:Transcript_6360/g.8222  ORF Transcript_6360/g.8222 Transcript_6360/m.8222 type:complete len:430 (+) Transcript_6360:14-1303(+)